MLWSLYALVSHETTLLSRTLMGNRKQMHDVKCLRSTSYQVQFATYTHERLIYSTVVQLCREHGETRRKPHDIRSKRLNIHPEREFNEEYKNTVDRTTCNNCDRIR